MRVVLVVLALVLSPDPAWADRFRMEYDGSAYGVIPLGGASIDIAVDADSYRAQAHIRSGGLAVLFDDTDLTARAEGEVQRRGVRVRRYQLDHAYARKRRVSDIRWTPSGVEALITPPHNDPEEIKPSAAQKAEARDPLSTIAAMAVDAARTGTCAGTYPTFDGRFRYDLTLIYEGQDLHRGGGYDGPVIKCKMQYRPVAGYRDAQNFSRRIPTGEIWFAMVPDARVAPPVRLTAPLPLGRAGIRLASFQQVEVDVGEAEAGLAP